MRKLILLMFGAMVVLAGCGSEKKDLINELKSEVEDRYSVLAFKSENESAESFQTKINQVFNDPEVWESRLFSFQIYSKIPTHPYDYERLLDIEKQPFFIVLDTEGIIFRSDKLTELEHFLIVDGHHHSSE